MNKISQFDNYGLSWSTCKWWLLIRFTLGKFQTKIIPLKLIRHKIKRLLSKWLPSSRILALIGLVWNSRWAKPNMWPFMRKGGLWISLKTVNFFHGHGAWIRVFTAWISNSTPVHSLREFFTLGVKLIMLRKISEDFHAVKLRVNTFSRREIKHVEGEWNLTCFFCFVFFLAPFRTGKKREYLVTSS